MCSHPFLVRLFQIGELSLSLGVSEPCYTLEIMIQQHLDSMGKVIENFGGVYLLGQPFFPWLSSLESLKP